MASASSRCRSMSGATLSLFPSSALISAVTSLISFRSPIRESCWAICSVILLLHVSTGGDDCRWQTWLYPTLLPIGTTGIFEPALWFLLHRSIKTCQESCSCYPHVHKPDGTVPSPTVARYPSSPHMESYSGRPKLDKIR